LNKQLTRATFRTSRLLDFCSEKELVAQTGHAVGDWPLVVVKELVDNSLDACEEAGIAPVIDVIVDDTGIIVRDNGPGIPPETVAGVLDFSERVSSREAYVAPDRGAQGNALKTLVAMPFVLDGKSGRIEVLARGIHHTISFTVDHIRQEPLIKHDAKPAPFVKKGTEVRIWWPSSACSILDRAEDRFLQIVDDYAFLNPHASISIDWRGTSCRLEATAGDWSKWRPQDPTSAHWYRDEDFRRLVGAYVSHDADRGRHRTVREFISEFRGLSGTAKQKAVLEATGLKQTLLNDLVGDDGFDDVRPADLLHAMKERTKPVAPKALGTIGRQHLEQRFAEEACEPGSFRYRKTQGVARGVPWVVETAFGWCPEGVDERRIITGVNWSPAIINPFRRFRYGLGLDYLLSTQRIERDDLVVLLVHVACARISYTDRGKSAIVIEDDALDEAILKAVEAVTGPWAKQKKAEERRESAKERREEQLTKTAEIKIKHAARQCMEEAYLKASANGTLPALARQIMYQARPYIQAATGKTLDGQYFCQDLLPDYIAETGVDWDVVFDARGHFAEPHTGHEFGLGTIAVRGYLLGGHAPYSIGAGFSRANIETSGPQGEYGAILFVEKEGFGPLFQAADLAARFDIAIMSTKGIANTAARRLAEELCSTYRIPLFVLHDFDKSGFSILGGFKKDTRRYAFTNKFQVVDFGLRLDDIEALGLDAEKANDKGKEAKRRANLIENGATPAEVEFLLKQRVELNALPSDELIAFVERKLEAAGVAKVIPDNKTLNEAFNVCYAGAIVEQKTREMIRKARNGAVTSSAPANLRAEIEKRLAERPHMSWKQVVETMATQAARKDRPDG